MENKEKFEKLLESVDRDGVEELLDWINTTDFFTAPASTRYHGAYSGGLVEHSLEVYDYLNMLVHSFGFADEIDSDSVIICALLHDICKANCYKTDFRNVKDDNGVWHKVPCYKFEEEFSFGGHGAKSVYITQYFMKLEPEEAAAINSHMGQFDATTYSNPSNVYSNNKLAWLLHVADEASTFLKED